MDDALPDAEPCTFVLSHVLQRCIGLLQDAGLRPEDIPAALEPVPPPHTFPGALAAVERLNVFIRTVGHACHRQFHGRQPLTCGFDPDRCYTDVHVGTMTWHELTVGPIGRAWCQRYRQAFTAAHGRSLATLAKEHIGAHPEKLISAAAHDVGCSPSTLRRTVRLESGDSPRGYRMRMRVAEMVQRLRAGDVKIEANGRQVGWHGKSGPYRAFHDLLGLTPGAVRKLPEHEVQILLTRLLDGTRSRP